MLRALIYFTVDSIKNHVCVMKLFGIGASSRVVLWQAFRPRPAVYQHNFVVATAQSCKPTSALNIPEKGFVLPLLLFALVFNNTLWTSDQGM